MKNIEKVLASKDKFISFKPADEKQISEAEKNLGLKFNKEYRRYVKKYGSGSYVGHELTGVTNCPEDDVVELTLQEKELNSDIPQGWYVLELTGIDGKVIWQDEAGNVYLGTEKICNSLIEYVEKGK